MRRTILFAAVAVLVLTFAALPASAAPPVHERFEVSGTWDPGTVDDPEFCSFDYVQSWEGIANVTTWGDPPAPDKQIWTGPIVVTHTNRNTEPDTVLIEKASYTVILEDNYATDFEAGVFWHLRDADTGKLVVVMAGKMVWNNVAGTITYTPNTDPDFWNVLCPALGGEVLPTP